MSASAIASFVIASGGKASRRAGLAALDLLLRR
jgi:hypothetical protein